MHAQQKFTENGSMTNFFLTMVVSVYIPIATIRSR